MSKQREGTAMPVEINKSSLPSWTQGTDPVRVPGRLLTCEPALDGPRTLTLSIVARDRVGLLAAILEHVHTHDPEINPDGGFVKVVEGYAVLFLVFRSWAVARPRVDHLIPVLRKFKETAPDGLHYPAAKVAVLSVHGPDRPGLLANVCRAIANTSANIQSLEIEPFAALPKGTDLLHGTGPISGTPVTDLTFTLEFPTRVPSDDLLAKLTAIAPGEVTAKFLG